MVIVYFINYVFIQKKLNFTIKKIYIHLNINLNQKP